MKRTLLILCLCLVSLSAFAFEPQPLFTPIAGYSIYDKQSEQSDYKDYSFMTGKSTKETVEGKYYKTTYQCDKNAKCADKIYIVKNHINALERDGGSVVYVFPNKSGFSGHLNKDGKDVWVRLQTFSGGKSYSLIIVERTDMEQEVKTGELLDSINRTGKITLYVNFETGSFFIQPDSYHILDEITELMNSNPSLKLAVRGYTDNTGSPSGNLALSEYRAKMIKYSLQIKGISPDRLTSQGFGRSNPVADNSTEDGRAKNRRVELVKID